MKKKLDLDEFENLIKEASKEEVKFEESITFKEKEIELEPEILEEPKPINRKAIHMEEKEREMKIKGIRDYSQEELEQKLKEIKAKILSNKTLTPEEKLVKYEYEEIMTQQEAQRQALIQEEVKRQVEVEQIKMRKEFEAADTEEKLGAEVKGTYLKKGSGALNEFFAKRTMNKVSEKAKKKGGTIIEKVYADSSIELIWSKKPIKFVEFSTINERGEQIKTISRVSKTKHRLKGSPVPVQVVLEGVSENINLHEGADMSLSAQHINQMNMLFYEAGYLDALDAKEQKKMGFDLNKLMPILILISIGISIVVAWQLSQLYTDLGTLRTAIQALNAGAHAVVPIVVPAV